MHHRCRVTKERTTTATAMTITELERPVELTQTRRPESERQAEVTNKEEMTRTTMTKSRETVMTMMQETTRVKMMTLTAMMRALMMTMITTAKTPKTTNPVEDDWRKSANSPTGHRSRTSQPFFSGIGNFQ